MNQPDCYRLIICNGIINESIHGFSCKVTEFPLHEPTTVVLMFGGAEQLFGLYSSLLVYLPAMLAQVTRLKHGKKKEKKSS